MHPLRQLRTAYQSVIWLMLLISLSSCTWLPGFYKDPFYKNSGGFDSFRLPLLKPYYLTYLDTETSWDMELQADPPSESTYYYLTLHDIQKIAIANGIIMLYTPYIERSIDPNIGQKIYHWFAIVPSANIEEGFENEDDFLEYVKEFDIQQINWQSPEDLYKIFTRTGCLDWIPGCH